MKNKEQTKALSLLKEIFESTPKQGMCEHLTHIFSDYNFNIEGVADKDFLRLVSDYKGTLELERSIPHSRDIDKIIEDARDLSNILDEEEDF